MVDKLITRGGDEGKGTAKTPQLNTRVSQIRTLTLKITQVCQDIHDIKLR